jgi:nucleoside-diphosphate-sugar epimerase
MRVVVTGGAGFIGRAIVARLTARGELIIALVRDPATAAHLAGERVELVRSDLSDAVLLRESIRGADALIHSAGMYRVGIRPSERAAMWQANVGATERVLDAAIAAGVPRLVYLSTNNIVGDTGGAIVDETHRRPPDQGFLSWYDETKYRAHEAAEQRIAAGAPIVIVQPGQTYGPNDHSQASDVLRQAHAGRLRYLVFPTAGLAWAHVDDLADGIVAAIDRGRIGQAYSLAGECYRLAEVVAIAARVAGRRPPRWTVPTTILRSIAPVNDRFGGLPGLPADLRETIRASEGVTYWVSHDKASRELGFAPRPLEQGVADTWGRVA